MQKILALIIAPFLSLISFLGFSEQPKAMPDSIVPEVIQQGSFRDISTRKVDGLMAVLPESTTTAVGSTVPVRIVFQPREKLLLSTGAFRLEYKYESTNPIIIVDANPEKPGIQIAINESLIRTGSWSYLINTVTDDKENKKLIIDLAFAYISPDGFTVEKEILLGQFDVTATEKGTVDFVFVPQQSMIMTKDGMRLLLDLKNAQFLVQ